MATKAQIKSIQVLRGIAACMVMIYHKRACLNFGKYQIGEWLFGAGAMGVDLFFIVSGFIMVLVNNRTKNNQHPTNTAWHFWVNRVARILPLYYLATIGFYYLVWRGGGFWHDAISRTKIFNSMGFIPLDGQKEAPFFGYAAITVGWTLNYEMFFYGLLTLSLLGGKFRYWIFTSVLMVLLLVVPLIFKGSVSLDAHHSYHFKYSYINLITNPIIWDFILGMLLGAWYLFKSPKWNKGVYYFLISVFSIWILGNLLLKWYPGHGVTRWALPLFGLIAALVFYEAQYGLKISKVWLFLGKISFSLYLLHPIVQYAILSFLVRHHLDKWTDTPFYLLACIALTILVATITQKIIEEYLSDGFKKLLLLIKK